MRPVLHIMALALAAVLSSACSNTTPEEYVELVESSRACGADGECVLAGAGECTCAAPVNKSDAEEVQEAADDVECEGAVVRCPAHNNVRCEAGRCVSDESE